MARPDVWLCRHGETEWSSTGRHTSHTDLPLTPEGIAEVRRLTAALVGVTFDVVVTSPLLRAAETAALVGFPEARRDPALAEWDYGEYEGKTTGEIREHAPGWTVWTQPAPGGETADRVAARADTVIERLSAEATDRALIFSHAHFLRVLGARWVDQPPAFGQHLLLDTATISVLSWEREKRAIGRWNVGP